MAGVVLLSDSRTGELRALLDAAAVTALRTGAAAVLAAETLRRPSSGPAAVIGAGVNGRAVARTFVARGRSVLVWDSRASARKSSPRIWEARSRRRARRALAAGSSRR